MVIPGRGAPLHAAGAPPTSGTVTAILAVVIILMALTPVCVYIWKSRGCPRPRLPDRTRHRYRRDMRNVSRRGRAACACCGGVNTRLRRDRAQWVCKNRDLCRKSMVYMNMLESL
jgi:hypothetical protein